jgi:hypothetical protein
MGYYQGDFYRGARGDPGFFSFLGGLAKKAVSFIPGVGPIASTAIDVASKLKGSSVVRAGSAIVKAHPVLTAAGAAGAVGLAGKMMGGGSPAAAGLAHAGRMMGSGGRRHRRMRVTNPKALRRAIRRAHGFAKLAMKTIHLIHPKKKVRFGGFRRPKKRT